MAVTRNKSRTVVNAGNNSQVVVPAPQPQPEAAAIPAPMQPPPVPVQQLPAPMQLPPGILNFTGQFAAGVNLTLTFNNVMFINCPHHHLSTIHSLTIIVNNPHYYHSSHHIHL